MSSVNNSTDKTQKTGQKLLLFLKNQTKTTKMALKFLIKSNRVWF